MSLKFYNTATRRKEEFQPLEDGKVGMYVCGVTVYDLCHIGHASTQIVFDVLARYLRARGYRVTHVCNFTDIDDKIIDRANQTGKDPAELAQENINAFYEDMGRLGVKKADFEPRATEHISGMINMIKVLLEKSHAYVNGNDVYYAVESFKGYGELSGRRLDELKEGARVAVDEKKRHPMDFVLWKGAKPGEPEWPSPWGPGRPGWHMECSVMSSCYLGNSFDIHGGGLDLIFPHHENERAQSLAANGGEFARYWIHNGFVTVDSEKMSKSLGNFLTIRDALLEFPPEVLRLFLLSKHYRSPLDFSRKDVRDFQSGLVRIYRTLEKVEGLLGAHKSDQEGDSGYLAEVGDDGFLRRFVEVMDDDLNTAAAIGLVFDQVREINKKLETAATKLEEKEKEALSKDRRDLFLAGKVLGLFTQKPAEFFQGLASGSEGVDEKEIERLIEERKQAKADKNWARADAIRDDLKERGIILEDTPKGTTWRMDV